MAETIKITMEDRTKPVSQKGLKKIAIFDPTKEIPYQEIYPSTSLDEYKNILTTDLVVEMLGKIWEQTPQGVVVFGRDCGVEDVKVALDENIGDYYFVLTSTRDNKIATEIAKWAGEKERIFIYQPAITSDIANIVSLSKEWSTDNAAIYAHRGYKREEEAVEQDVFLDAAICGKIAPKDEGSVTWALQELNGVGVNEYLSSDEGILAKANVNYYEEELGRSITKGGKTTSGSYIDITRAKAWLKHRIKEELFMLLVNNDKVPYTDEGIYMVKTAIDKVLQFGISKGILQATDGGKKETKCRVPLYKDILSNTVASRRLEGVEVIAILAGAIEVVNLNIILTL